MLTIESALVRIFTALRETRKERKRLILCIEVKMIQNLNTFLVVFRPMIRHSHQLFDLQAADDHPRKLCKERQ